MSPMLPMSFFVSQAFRDVDVLSKYPVFAQQLQDNPELKQHFEDSLALMKASASQNGIQLPGPANRDLSFLTRRPAPAQETISPTSTRLTFFAESLTAILHPQDGMIFPNTLEDGWFPIYRSRKAPQFSLEGQLQGSGTIHLLLVVNKSLQEDVVILESVTLEWADQSQTLKPGTTSLILFREVNVDEVVTGSQVTSDLVLTITTITEDE